MKNLLQLTDTHFWLTEKSPVTSKPKIHSRTYLALTTRVFPRITATSSTGRLSKSGKGEDGAVYANSTCAHGSWQWVSLSPHKQWTLKPILHALVLLCSVPLPGFMTRDDRFHFLINFIMHALGAVLRREAPWCLKYNLKNATCTIQEDSREK